MSKVIHYLVIRADRTVRVTKRSPRLAADEVAIRINLEYPAHWGRVLTDAIDIKVPDFAPEVHYEQTMDN
jgi:hypothetical protein